MRIIERLYNNGDLDKATLAGLRGAVTITSPKAQKVWPVIMNYLPKEYLSKNGKPTTGEIAVYAAVRFYAIFQQGQDRFVYEVSGEQAEGENLFTALAALRKVEEIKKPLDHRVQALLATTNIDSVINSLTHLVEILKGKDKTKKIDYPQLAQNLYKFQMNYHCANEVRLAWGEQYFGLNNEGKQL